MTSTRSQTHNTDDDDVDQFQDAQNVHPQVQVLQEIQPNIGELVKRKNTYAKKRLTMTENYIASMEKQTSVNFRESDFNMLENHLNAAEKAIQKLTDCIESSTHVISMEEIDAFMDLADAHSPRILDIRARINRLQTNFLPSTPLSTLNNNAPNQVKKIDNTFRPDPLMPDATPAIFHRWRDQFDIFVERNGLQNLPFKQLRVLVTKCLSPEMDQTLERASQPGESTTLKQLITKLETLVTGSSSLITRRFQYFKCIQHPEETIKQYIVRFRQIGDYASFDEFSYDESMACRLISGVHDDQLRRELLRLPKHDFDSVYNFAMSYEMSNSDTVQMSQKDTQHADNLGINKMSKYKTSKRDKFHKHLRPNNQFKQSNEGSSCQYCGLKSHGENECQAKNHKCGFCKRMGHFAKVCRKRIAAAAKSKPNDQVRSIEEADPQSGFESDESNEENHINVIRGSIFEVTSLSPSRATPRIMASFFYKNKFLSQSKCLPDTGASCSVLPISIAKAWGILDQIHSEEIPLRSANGTQVTCSGTVPISVAFQGIKAKIIFYVCSNVSSILLSWHALLQLDVVSGRFPNRLSKEHKVHQIEHITTLKSKFINAFNNVFNPSNKLPCMLGDKMKIHLKTAIDWPSVKQAYKPRTIPAPLRDAAKLELDNMLKRNIIRPVTSPTQFTSPLLVVPKKGGKVRLVVDYTQLNKYVQRPIHPFPSVEDVKTMISPNARYFATLDALQGYWQIPLCEQSQLLTTFITPWGRFAYTRAPMGLTSSGDVFCQRGDEAFSNLHGVIKVVDDLLIHAPSEHVLEQRINQVLQAADKFGVTLSPDKFIIGTSVTFMGLQISSDGIGPDPKHIKAISEFPPPSNKTDLRSFLGLVNQFGSFTKDIATHSKAIRPLLSKESEWQWNEEHNKAFLVIKKLLVQSPVLKYFNPKLPTKLVTDASKLNGLGFALMQKYEQGWALISCGSRYISSTEANYAVCELEALAIAWAIRKSRIYLMGLPHFDVVTDHRPLVSMFNSSRLVRNDNPRLIRIMQQVVMYNFTVHWTPGKMNNVPDALSRSPVDPHDDQLNAVSDVPIEAKFDPALNIIIQHAGSSYEYSDLKQAISSLEINDVKKLDSDRQGHIKSFLSIWDQLSIDEKTGLIVLDGHRIVVPKSIIHHLLKLAHAAHQGISRTKARLHSLYFWHGMSNDITQLVQNCNLCQTHRSSQPTQPISAHPIPEGPFVAVSCDLFEYKGSHTLTLVDRYSAYPLVCHFSKSPSTAQLVAALSKFFTDFGIPRKLRHDGAKPLVSQEFKTFLSSHNIEDQISSAYNPRSNGHAEASVKAIKSLVKKCWQVRQLNQLQFNNALLEWRNTPKLPGGLSPAELLFGRKTRSLLPVLINKPVSHRTIRKAVLKNYQSLTRAYNLFNSRKTYLRPLNVGDEVRIRNTTTNLWDRSGIITKVRPGGLSYLVESNGKIYLRNRSLLNKTYNIRSSD